NRDSAFQHAVAADQADGEEGGCVGKQERGGGADIAATGMGGHGRKGDTSRPGKAACEDEELLCSRLHVGRSGARNGLRVFQPASSTDRASSPDAIAPQAKVPGGSVCGRQISHSRDMCAANGSREGTAAGAPVKDCPKRGRFRGNRLSRRLARQNGASYIRRNVAGTSSMAVPRKFK